jgi:hypothetical protein
MRGFTHLLALAAAVGSSLTATPAVMAAPDQAAQGGTKAMFATKAEAEAAAKQFNCKGAHPMGEMWMPCASHGDPSGSQASPMAH